MNDINWIRSLDNNFADLEQWFAAKLFLGSCISACCAVFGIDLLLFYFLLGALTVEAVARSILSCRRNRGLCRGLQRGITRYICYGAFLFMAIALQVAFKRSLGLAIPVADIFMCYLIITDCASILGHLNALGVPIPKGLRFMIVGGKRKIERKIEEITHTQENGGGKKHGS